MFLPQLLSAAQAAQSVFEVIRVSIAQKGGAPVKKQPVKKAPKPGRNDPCPCGKMKADGSRRLKYKECCGRNE